MVCLSRIATYLELVDHKRNDTDEAIVFLSDGVANEPHFDEPGYIHTNHHFEVPCPIVQLYTQNELRKAADNGAIIYTIGIGAEAYRFDEKLLREMETGITTTRPQA